MGLGFDRRSGAGKRLNRYCQKWGWITSMSERHPVSGACRQSEKVEAGNVLRRHINFALQSQATQFWKDTESESIHTLT